MTNPNDDVGSVADPGALGPDEMTEPDNDLDADRNDDAQHRDAQHRDAAAPGIPGAAADSPAAQGSPIGPPD